MRLIQPMRAGLLVRGVVVPGILLFACGCRTQAEVPVRTSVVRVAGTMVAESLAEDYARALPTLTVQNVPVSNTVAIVDAIQRGDADVGVSYADVVYAAYAAEGEAAPGQETLRAIAALRIAPLLLLARDTSGIRRIEDLPGHSVRTTGTPDPNDLRFREWKIPASLSSGNPRARVTSLSELVLLGFRIDRNSLRARVMPQADAFTELIGGALDALFLVVYDSDTPVSEALRHGARLIPLEGAAIDRLRQAYPFIRPVSIPAGTYPGQQAPLHTVGVDIVLVCRRDLDEQVVHDLTRAYFEVLPNASTTRNLLVGVNLQQAPATPIPLHDGAARFFREWERLR